MTVFEDPVELWQNALEEDDVPTVEGPPSIKTLFEACDRFEEMRNEPRGGCLVISLEMAREIPRGWVEIEHDTVPDDHEEFRPFENMVTVTERVGGHEAFICRSDAVCLNMEILDPTGVVVIDFDRGDIDG